MASKLAGIVRARIDAALKHMVTDGCAAGTSGLIWNDGCEVNFGASGDADRKAKRPMRQFDEILNDWPFLTGDAIMVADIILPTTTYFASLLGCRCTLDIRALTDCMPYGGPLRPLKLDQRAIS